MLGWHGAPTSALLPYSTLPHKESQSVTTAHYGSRPPKARVKTAKCAARLAPLSPRTQNEQIPCNATGGEGLGVRGD